MNALNYKQMGHALDYINQGIGEGDTSSIDALLALAYELVGAGGEDATSSIDAAVAAMQADPSTKSGMSLSSFGKMSTKVGLSALTAAGIISGPVAAAISGLMALNALAGLFGFSFGDLFGEYGNAGASIGSEAGYGFADSGETGGQGMGFGDSGDSGSSDGGW
jgi:hypothetical protein